MGKGKREKEKRRTADGQSPLAVVPGAKAKDKPLPASCYVREVTLNIPSVMYDNLEDLAVGAARGGMFGHKNLKAGKAAAARLFISHAIGAFAESYATHLVQESQKLAAEQNKAVEAAKGEDRGIMTVDSRLVGPDGKPVSSDD